MSGINQDMVCGFAVGALFQSLVMFLACIVLASTGYRGPRR